MSSTHAATGADVASEHLANRARSANLRRTVLIVKWLLIGMVLTFLVAAAGYVAGARSSAIPSNAVDAGFLADMSDHHDQAVTMALHEASYGDDPIVMSFARDVLLFQRWELGLMHAYQTQHGDAPPEYSAERSTMAWMGMPTPLSNMPGMASTSQLDQLRKARGRDADLLFLQLMMEHHTGGTHMARFAAQHAADPQVRELAERIATNQPVEVKEYEREFYRLGGR